MILPTNLRRKPILIRHHLRTRHPPKQNIERQILFHVHACFLLLGSNLCFRYSLSLAIYCPMMFSSLLILIFVFFAESGLNSDFLLAFVLSLLLEERK